MAEAVAPSISNYEILSQLSSGGMGAVYLAEDLKLHRKVAIKALTPEWAADPDRYRRFRWEAQVLAKLNHPNIVTIYAIEEEEGAHFLIMELVEGKTLDQLIPSVGMSAEEIFRVAIPLANALAAAHERGIIHRDLKPGNVMVTDDGRVKVLDFGLAKRQDSAVTPGAAQINAHQPETQVGQMMGTIPYMSPEQLQGDSIDPRTDIFSLGIILFEMATGSRPFEGKTWGDLASSILRDKPPSVTMLNVYLPRHLGRIIRHCLEKDPQRRFQTALDLRNELEELQREMLTGDVGLRSDSGIHSGAAVLRADRDSLSDVRTRPFFGAGEPRGGAGDLLATQPDLSGVATPVSEKKRDGEKWIAVGATLLVTIAVAALFWLRAGNGAGPSTSAPEPSAPIVADGRNRIVVLPLENLGPEEHAYFAAGITDEITSRLASVSALQVISRTTALQYDRADKTAQQVGAELGVDYLLDGTVRWSTGGDENRVRVTPQLIRVVDDTQIWSERYDRVIDDIIAVQSEIAAEVIRQLDIALLEPEREALAARPTGNLEAYQAYLRGMDFASRRESQPETWRLAVQMFSRATELDPRFALAYAELSEAHSLVYFWNIDPSPERREKAREAAERALAIDPNLPEGHRALAYYYYRGYRDYEKALREFDIAARALPNDSQLLEGTAYIWRRQGRFEEAVANLEKAIEIQPKSDWMAAELARTYTTMRRYGEADRYYQLAISLVPDQPAPYQVRAHNFLLWRGDIANARATLEEMPRQDETSSVLAWYHLEVIDRNEQAALNRLNTNTKAKLIGIESISYPRDLLHALAYQRLGDLAKARNSFENARGTLERLLPEGTVNPRLRIALGITYAGLDRKDDAVREGLAAVEEYSISQDAFIGPQFVEHLALIYVMVGDYEAALDRIELLLSIPSELSVPLLALDPKWDPLREHPRFKALIENAGGQAGALEATSIKVSETVPARHLRPETVTLEATT